MQFWGTSSLSISIFWGHFKNILTFRPFLYENGQAFFICVVPVHNKCHLMTLLDRTVIHIFKEAQHFPCEQVLVDSSKKKIGHLTGRNLEQNWTQRWAAMCLDWTSRKFLSMFCSHILSFQSLMIGLNYNYVFFFFSQFLVDRVMFD